MKIIMPVKDRIDMTDQFIERFTAMSDCEQHQLHILDNGSETEPRWFNVHDTAGMNIYQQWNWALDNLVRPYENVAFVNNDIALLTDRVFSNLDDVLTDMTIGLVSPDHGFPHHTTMQERSGARVLHVLPSPASSGGPAGFCFAIPPRVHYRFRFNEQFQWWFGDTDLFWTIHFLFGLHCVIDMASRIEHIDGGSQSSKHLNLDELTAADQKLFEEAWSIPAITS